MGWIPCSTPLKAVPFPADLRASSPGLAVIIGEFGYYTTSTPSDQFYQCALANFAVGPSHGVGLLAWHATMLYGFELTADGTAFYEHTNGSGLSNFGTRLWALAH